MDVLDILINNNFKTEFIVIVHNLNAGNKKNLLKILDEKLSLNKKILTLSSKSLKLDDNLTISLTELGKEVEVIILDDFELVSGNKGITRFLKTISLTNNIPIIVLYRFDDKLYQDFSNKEIFAFSSIVGGELVQDSDLFALLDKNDDSFKIMVLKNRYGILNEYDFN